MPVLRLRYRWFWVLLGWLLVVTVAAASVLPGVDIRGISAVDKLGHGAAYFVLMVWFAGLYARRQHGIVALTLLGLGVVLEVIQGQLPYRWSDPLDLVANATGIGIGLGLSWWLLAGWCQRVERRLGYHE